MDTSATEITRDASGRFLPGQSGNPAGKKPGTRNRKTLMLEALRDGEDVTAARVVIDKATAGDAVAARFVVSLVSPRPRGRLIQLDMPEGDDCNVVTAFNVTLRALCQGEITPDEALTVSRFLDGRLKTLQAWQLEEKLTSFGRTIPGDPAWALEQDALGNDEDEEEDDDGGTVMRLTEVEAMAIAAHRAQRAGRETAASATTPVESTAPDVPPSDGADAPAPSPVPEAPCKAPAFFTAPAAVRAHRGPPVTELDAALAASVARRLRSRIAAE